MKMAKKLLALVLTGVMAMSVLTGCGSTASRQAVGELEGMLKKANPNATVADGSETLANTAIDAATKDGEIKTDAITSIVAALKNANKNEYVWYTYFKAEGTDKAQAISKVVLIGDGKAIDDISALNGISLKHKGYKPGDEFVLSMKEFTVKETSGSKTTDVVYIMAVVTCKPVK